MWRSLGLLALLVARYPQQAEGHPICYPNNNPPDADKTASTFCPAQDFNGDDFLQFGSCCTDVQELVIEAKFLEAGTLTPGCSDLYKQLLCGQCHSFSGHLFASLLEDELGPWDGMTMKRDFCEALIDECGDEIVFGGPAEYGGQSYCDKHVGGLNGQDEFWSYPYQDPDITPGELRSLFPDINGQTQFPKWILSLRQSPDASMWWILGIEGEVKKVMASDMGSISLVVDISDVNFYDSREEGLLDMAFDPEFTTNNYFYLSHSVNLGDTGSDGQVVVRNRISRFTYVDGSPAQTRATEKILLTTDAKDTEIHSAGWLGFKPSAYGQGNAYNDLYWTTGDGGPPEDPNNRAQDLNNLLGAMIRISVPSFDEVPNYQIPSGNYQDVDSSAAPELCAPGLRNPWRCSFDRATDELWCGDVGQERVEEVNIIECGNNYGWSRFEGSSCQAAVEDNGINPPCATGSRAGFTFPEYEYCHPDFAGDDPDYNGGVDICGNRDIAGLAIIGGFVYRGQRYADLLEGAYIFADQVTRFIYFIKKNEEGEYVGGTIISEANDIFISFEEDINGELYVVTRQWQIYYLPCGDLCSGTCLEQNEQAPAIESQGCFADQPGNRALQLHEAANCGAGETFMSPLICASYCSTIDGAVYAGVEAGTDCYCGAEGENFAKNGPLDSEEFCITLCDSNSELTCGGDNAIEVFEIGSAVVPITPAPGGGTIDLFCVNGLVGIDGANEAGEPVCCSLGCGFCGGDGCGQAPGGNTACCPNGILNNQQDCAVSGEAPCFITDAPGTTPAPVEGPTPAPATPAPVDVTGPTCADTNGIPGIQNMNTNGKVCCPLQCNQCGGVGCGSNGDSGFGSDECCVNGVLGAYQVDCTVSGEAPCIIGDDPSTPAPVEDPTPAPVVDPTPAPGPQSEVCSNGIPGIDGSNEFGDVCCPLQCNQCGDVGCGQAPGGNTVCCINGVLNNQPDCSDSGEAPCVIGNGPTPAPVVGPTPAPVVNSTPAPVVNSTPAPVDDSTPAPFDGPTCADTNGIPGIQNMNTNGKVCCPLQCNQCGGAGCGSNGDTGFGKEECCVNGVLDNYQIDCTVSGEAPCIIGDDVATPAPVPPVTPSPVDPTPTTPAPVDVSGPTCSNGFPGYEAENEVGRVCCPVACGQCGDLGCGTSGLPAFDNTGCCINGVLNNQPDCSTSGAAPCVVGLGPATTPAPGATPAPFTPVTIEGYLGCFQDDRDVRILPDQQQSSPTQMTAAFCKASCTGYDYYGTQFGGECWCGSGTPAATYELYGELPGGDCDSDCTGDSSEACGGRLKMSVYTV